MTRPDPLLPNGWRATGASVRLAAAATLAATLLAGCGTTGHGTADGALPQRASPVACRRLPAALADWPGLQISQAREQPADGAGHPAHCLVQGRLAERQGRDGRRYAIGFELRLPQGWTGRLLHQPQAGTVAPAYGALAVQAGLPGPSGADALARGFAVLSSDGGHDARTPAPALGLAAPQAYGADPQARVDLAHAADAAVWPLARALATRHYGEPPRFGYIAGCGEGGRRAVMAASRHPDQYDGYLAGAPALNLPRATLAQAWSLQSWLALDADPRRAFTPAQLRWVAERVLARCDALDLLVDGVVSDVRRCQRSLRFGELQCRPGDAERGSACLSPLQVQALERAFGGPQTADGDPLYAEWPLDPGIAGAQWRRWQLDSGEPAFDGLPLLAVLAGATLSQVMATPPADIGDGSAAALRDFLAGFDMDRDSGLIAAQDAQHRESALDQFTPPDVGAPQLAGLGRHGGRLLVYHGVADPVFSALDTLHWTERLQSALGLAVADQRARVFAVPGMNHCTGGPATDRFDALGALVDWVEQGRAPERIDARVDPANPELPRGWSPQRSRALCPWPRLARYAGGDVESAASFRCAMP